MIVIRKSKASSIRVVFSPVVLNLLSRWIMPDFEEFFEAHEGPCQPLAGF
jgi:hypothetical protein